MKETHFKSELTGQAFRIQFSDTNTLDPSEDRPDFCPHCGSSNFRRGLLTDRCEMLSEDGTKGCGLFAIRDKEQEMKEKVFLSFLLRVEEIFRKHFSKHFHHRPHLHQRHA